MIPINKNISTVNLDFIDKLVLDKSQNKLQMQTKTEIIIKLHIN